MTVYAIIPARAGSKGVPGKNFRPVGGRELWIWSVLAAMECPEIDRVGITTDNHLIRHDAERLGVDFISRPAELATDEVPLDAALLHAVEFLGLDGDDILVTLQPTVPVRRPGLISECLRTFRAFPAARSLVTANRLHFVYDGDSGELLNPPRVNRQGIKRTLFHEDGSVFLCRAGDFRASGRRVMDPIALYESPRTVDIDTEADLQLADLLLRAESFQASGAP